MSSSPTLLTRVSSLAAGLALGFALTACADGPTEPRAEIGGPLFDHAGGHTGPSRGGPAVKASVYLEAEVTPSTTIAGDCDLVWGFQLEGKGRDRTIRWAQYWIGGDHPGLRLTGTGGVGTGIDPIILVHGHIHANDAHTIDAIRILVMEESDDPDNPSTILGEASTGPVTFTC